MAAGLVYHDITLAEGVTIQIASWVPDTGAPDDNAIPVHIVFDATGVEVWTAAKITTMLGYLDGLEGKLDSLHTDLGTTLAGYLDGVEGKLDTLHADMSGGVAHDAADSGSPVKIGHKATTSLAGLTLVANADRTDSFAGVDGVPIVRPHCNLEDIVTGNATNTDGTSTSCIAAQGVGIKTYLTSVVLCNTSASAITVDIKNDTTVKVSLPLPAGSGCIYNPPVPIPGTANKAWSFDPSAAASTVTCSMVGFKSKV